MVIKEPTGIRLHDQLNQKDTQFSGKKRTPSRGILKAVLTLNEYKKTKEIENFPTKIRQRIDNIENNPLPPKPKLSKQIVVSLSNGAMKKLEELVKTSQIPKSKFLRYAMLYYLHEEKMKPQYNSTVVVGLTEQEHQEIRYHIPNIRRYVENIITDIDQDAIEYIEDHAKLINYNFQVNNEQKKKISKNKISTTQLVRETIQTLEGDEHC